MRSERKHSPANWRKQSHSTTDFNYALRLRLLNKPEQLIMNDFHETLSYANTKLVRL